MQSTTKAAVFVAADTDVFANLTTLLPGRHVWWSNLTQTTVVSSRSSSGNPGTDLSAFVDMYLLSRCKDMVLTAGSSFGSLAAGYSNVAPVYAVRGGLQARFGRHGFGRGCHQSPYALSSLNGRDMS